MNRLITLLLFVILTISISSCIFQPKPHKGWYKKRGVRLHHYHGGNNYGGRRMWVHQYRTY